MKSQPLPLLPVADFARDIVVIRKAAGKKRLMDTNNPQMDATPKVTNVRCPLSVVR